MRRIEFGDHVQLMQGFYRIAIKHFAIPFRDTTFSQEYQLEHLERKHRHVKLQVSLNKHKNVVTSTFNFAVQ